MNELLGSAMLFSFLLGVVMGVVVTVCLSRRGEELKARKMADPDGYQPEGEGLDTSSPPQGGSGAPLKLPAAIVAKLVRRGLYLEPRGSHETDPFAEKKVEPKPDEAEEA